MNSNIKVIIFDFGGVLLNWDPHQLYRRYFNQPQQIDQFLVEINFTAWNTEQDRGRPFAEGITLLSNQFPQYGHLIRDDGYFARVEAGRLSAIRVEQLVGRNISAREV